MQEVRCILSFELRPQSETTTLVVDNIFLSQPLRFFVDFEVLKLMGMNHVVLIVRATRSQTICKVGSSSDPC